MAKRFGVQSLQISTSGIASTSRGLVGDTNFAIIPNVKPIHTFIITIVFQIVSPNSYGIVIVYFESFLDIPGQIVEDTNV